MFARVEIEALDERGVGEGRAAVAAHTGTRVLWLEANVAILPLIVG